MADYLIKGATIVDGTGAPGVVGDVAVADGKIVAVGAVDETAATTLDADGLVVAPGFVDPHTHYDAQLLWDPLATPSGVHGVTSIIAGNCGFTLAPLRGEADADYTRRMMAKVEGMPLKALEEGVTWDWSSFGEYLGRLEGRIALNAGFLVGHCAIRRYVMGAEATGNAATADQVDAMVRLLDESIEAGGLGFSTTLSNTHSDGDGEPVASRFAERDEILALCAAVGRHEGTTLEAIVNGCLDRFADDEIDLLAAMSAAAQRPLNWNVLTVDSRVPDRVPRQLQASRAAAAAGGRIVALTMPVLVPMNMSFLNYCALNMLPDWGPVLGLPVPERMVALRDPETRRRLEARRLRGRRRVPSAGRLRQLRHRRHLQRRHGAVSLPGRGRHRRRGGQGPLRHVARHRARRRPAHDPVAHAARQRSRAVDDAPRADDPDVMLGGSDAGAHLDRMMGASYTTRFLGDCLRGRKLVDLERAVHMLTDAPAQLFGLRGRGRIAAGYHADLVVFDPERIGASNATLVNDLPGGTARLMSEAEGVVRVLVNGTEIVRDNRATDAVPGTVLRSGVDTDTVRTS
ncbi:MAG: amidohydrolase family protein [Acidimicrobiales bacterium]